MLSIKEAKEISSNYTGITINGNSMRMTFMYQGKRCLETLKNVPLTKSNIKSAFNKRMAICHDIELGKFSYTASFPNSKTALKLAMNNSLNDQSTLNEYLDKVISSSKVNDRPKTHKSKVNRINKYIRPYLGARSIKDIKTSEIRLWINSSFSHIGNKTIGDVLTPLRSAFSLATEDGIFKVSPMDLIKNPKKEKTDNADPFTRAQISKLVAQHTERCIELDAFIFAIWTGLRPSELFALAVSDIDLDSRKIYINRGLVQGVYAYTKNDGSYRCVDLLDEAFNILDKMRPRLHKLKFSKVSILQSNNRLFNEEKLQFIFTSSKSGRVWRDSDSFNKQFLRPHCESSGVIYRGIGQARHTYGSQLITANVNLNWIAKQMGHSSIKMLEKHYGRWMESEIPDMAAQVSKKFKDKKSK